MTGELRRLAALFRPIALEQAEARAALSVRTDRKYVIDAATFALLVERLAPDHYALEVRGRRLRGYDTIYFDTPDLASYRQHMQGRRRRFKCRTRLYLDGPCYFEVKLKGGRGETVKRRLAVPETTHGALPDSALRFLEAELRGAYGLGAPAGLVASVATAFTRLTLVAEDERERVTCDIGLTLRSGKERHEILAGRVLVETKTLLGNGAADRHLRRLGARPFATCSKYCLGVALTHPDVRTNRLRRLLRRNFPGSVRPVPVLAEGI